MNNATKKDLVNFVNLYVRKDGKKIPKKELNLYSKEKLQGIIKKVDLQKEFETFVKEPKKSKYFVICEKNGNENHFDFKATSKEECINFYEKEGYVVKTVVSSKKYHRCKYCLGIANGTNKDILCEDCKDLFGHTYFHEL